MRNNSARIQVFWSLAVVAPLAFHAGCMTLEQMAPPVDIGLQRVAARWHVDVPTLEVGRQVYLGNCARCHGVEPISRYSKSRWREILPRMGRETKLDAKEQAAVNAYVMLAHTFLNQESTKLVSAENSQTQ